MKSEILKPIGIKKIVCHELARIIRKGILECDGIGKDNEMLSEDVKLGIGKFYGKGYVIETKDFSRQVDEVAKRIWRALFEEEENEERLT